MARVLISPRKILGLLKEAFADWREDKAARLAAALAYYAVFALAPLLVIFIAIAGLAFGREAAQGRIVEEIDHLIGRDGAAMVQDVIESGRDKESSGVAGIFGVLLLLFGASGVFGQLQDGLNTIWEVTPKPGRGIFGIIKDRFLSFTMVLGVGFLLLVSLALTAGVTAVGEATSGLFPETLGKVLLFLVSFAVVTLLFAMIYQILPDVEIAWRDVWLGAAVTALLFTIGKFLIGLYLGSGSAGSAYGAAGGLVIFLLWVYYSAQILFFGAEFTQVYANRYGSRIVPDEDAVPVTEEARAQQGMPDKRRVARDANRSGEAAEPARGRRSKSAFERSTEFAPRERRARGERREFRERPGRGERRQFRERLVSREEERLVPLAPRPSQPVYRAVGAGAFLGLVIAAAVQELRDRPPGLHR